MSRFVTLTGQDLSEADFVPIPESSSATKSVIFNVLPTITESGSTLYTEITEMRQAASLLIFMGSPSRTFSINAKFVARTVAEASRNYLDIQLLKSWRMPESQGGGSGIEPPARLRLNGHGDTFNNVTVRMTDITVEYPEDVDYIGVDDLGTGIVNVPIVQTVNITLKEAKTINDLENFNIEQFRVGQLPGW